MDRKLSKPLIRFYSQTALAYLVLWLAADSANGPGTFWPRLVNNSWLIIYITVINYYFFEYVVPYIRKPRSLFSRAGWYLLSTICLLLLFSFGLYAWRALGIGLHVYTALIHFKSVEQGTSYIVPHGLVSVLFFAIFKYRYNHRLLKITAQQLELQKREAELNFLRAQTNPHFLFNTLNNIYVLARDKSELAPDSILRLSQMLRFMLYETGGAFIAIEQEIRIISEYLELEKLRYDDTLRLNFNYDVEDMKQAIPPLLLIPLIENAFKHGVSETREQPFADIHLAVNQRRLLLIVKNSTEETVTTVINERIGLANLRRQLELQYTDYELSLTPGPSQFKAALRINLASHV